MTGKITNVTDRGFGFITIDGAAAGTKDLFFHSENVVGITFNELQKGDAVSFEMGDGPKGPFASNVALLTGDASQAAE